MKRLKAKQELQLKAGFLISDNRTEICEMKTPLTLLQQLDGNSRTICTHDGKHSNNHDKRASAYDGR